MASANNPFVFLNAKRQPLLRGEPAGWYWRSAPADGGSSYGEPHGPFRTERAATAASREAPAA